MTLVRLEFWNLRKIVDSFSRGEQHHALCAIPFNLVNQYIFWLVFALYIVLSVWTALSLLGHVLLKFVPELRSALIWTQMPRVSSAFYYIDFSDSIYNYFSRASASSRWPA